MCRAYPRLSFHQSHRQAPTLPGPGAQGRTTGYTQNSRLLEPSGVLKAVHQQTGRVAPFLSQISQISWRSFSGDGGLIRLNRPFLCGFYGGRRVVAERMKKMKMMKNTRTGERVQRIWGLCVREVMNE